MGFMMRTIGVVALVACGLAAQANESEDPVYQRHRGGAGYGGQAAYGFSPGYFPGYPPLGLGYYQQPSYGDWFTRPYPTHLDYFRLRSRMPATQPASQDCPCAEQQLR